MPLSYRIRLDTMRNALFTGYFNDITEYVKRVALKYGAVMPDDIMGNAAYLEVVLNNVSGDFNLQDSTSRYYGRINRGTLIQLQASLNYVDWVTLGMLKIESKTPNYMMDGTHELIIKATDMSQRFFDQDFVPPLLVDVTVEEIIEAAFEKAVFIWPYESYYQFIGHTSIGDGRSPYVGTDYFSSTGSDTTLEFYGDNLQKERGVKVQEFIKSAVQAEVLGFFSFDPQSQLFKFFNRYYASETAPSWNITTSISDAPRYVEKGVINDYALSYYPRAIGDEGSVLWESQNVPFSIAPQDSKRITVKFRDPDFPNASVGALDVMNLVKGVDLIANVQEDGSGLDKSHKIDITLIKGSSGAELLLTNRKENIPLYITTLQVRGTPITAYDKEIVYGYNDDSIFGVGSDQSTGYDRASASESFSAISTLDFAQSVADFKVSTHGSELHVIETLSIPIKDDDSVTQAKVLSTGLGDVINFSDPANSHDSDYMIVGANHSITPNTVPAQHVVNYVLRPTQRSSLFVLGESLSDAGDVLSF